MSEFNKDLFDSVKNEYNSFKGKLEKKIRSKKITLQNNECYLIENIWENEFSNKITQIEEFLKSNNNKKLDKKIYNFYPEKNPIFYDNISSVINGIKKNKKFRLMSKKLIQNIYDKNNLIDINLVNYFTGNNLLIIEYKGKNGNNSILVINSLNEYNNNNLLIISFKIKESEKIMIYNKLLSQEINLNQDLKKKLVNNNIIINFEEILNNKNLSSFFDIFSMSKSENVNIFNDNILKIIINIYYFEKSLLQIDNDFFQKENYCLINPNWLQKFKDFYDFLKIYDLLNIYGKINKDINYVNLNEKIDDIVKYLSKNKLTMKNSKFPENLIDTGLITPTIITKYNIVFYKKCFIFPLNLIEMIKKYIFKTKTILIKPKKIFSNDENIFLIDGYTIIVGNLNDKLIFIPKYIFFYVNKKLLESEKSFFNSYSFIKYIKLRKCIENIYENQILKNENNEKIGELIILNDEIQSDNNSQESNKKLNPHSYNRPFYFKKEMRNGRYLSRNKIRKKNPNISLDKIKINNYDHYMLNNKNKLNKNRPKSVSKVYTEKGPYRIQDILQQREKKLDEKLTQFENKVNEFFRQKDNLSSKNNLEEINSKNILNELKEENKYLLKDNSTIRLELENQQKFIDKFEMDKKEFLNTKNQFKQFQKRMEELENDNKEKNEIIKLLKNDSKNYINNLKLLKDKIEEKDKVINKINESYNNNQKEFKTKETELIKINNDNEYTKNELSNALKTLEKLQSQINELKEENKKRDQIIQNYKSNHKEKEEIKKIKSEDSLKQNNEYLNEKKEVENKENDKSKINKEIKNDDKKINKNKNSKYNDEEIKKIIEKNERLKKENEELNIKIKELQRLLNEKDLVLSVYINKEDSLKKYYDEILDKKNKEFEELQNDYLNIKEKIKNKESTEIENHSIKEEYDSDNDEKSVNKKINYEKKISELGNNNKLLKNEIIDLEERIKQITETSKNKIKELLQHNNEKEKEIKILKNKEEKLENENKDLLKKFEEKEKEINNLILKNQNIENEIKEINGRNTNNNIDNHLRNQNNRKYENEIDYKKLLDENNKELEKLKKTNEEYEKKLNDMEDELQNQIDLNDEYIQENEKLLEKQKLLDEKKKKVEKINFERLKQMNILEIDNRIKKDNIKIYRNMLKEKQERIKEINGKYNEIKKELENKQEKSKDNN